MAPEEVGGQVMTVPGGHTLNSASWYVVDNHIQTVAGVERQTPVDGFALRLGANPSSGAVRLTFVLAHPSDG